MMQEIWEINRADWRQICCELERFVELATPSMQKKKKNSHKVAPLSGKRCKISFTAQVTLHNLQHHLAN